MRLRSHVGLLECNESRQLKLNYAGVNVESQGCFGYGEVESQGCFDCEEVEIQGCFCQIDQNTPW